MRASEFLREDAPEGLVIKHKPTSTGGAAVEAYVGNREVGFVQFQRLRDGNYKASMAHVSPSMRKQGIGREMYRYARNVLGFNVVPSDSQSDDAKAFWARGGGTNEEQHVTQTLVAERVDPRTEIENMSVILPGSLDEYFVRFTDQDKLGFSQKQHFGRTPDVGDADYDPHALPNRQGRPALWFYPLKYYLKQKDLYATNMPYVWLVRIKPGAWLQPVAGQTVKKDAPQGKERVGMLTKDQGVPMAIFFRPAFDVVDRWSTVGGKNES